MKIENLSKKEKIELIKRIQAGETHIINGEIIGSGVILIKKDEQYFLNGKLVDYEDLKKKVETAIILPSNNRDEI